MTRTHPAASYNALKTAWKRLVERLGGTDATAACTRVGRSRASEYGLVECERFVPVDVLLDAEATAGRPVVTETLAGLLGYRLVPRRDWPAETLARHLARIGHDAADVFATASAALEDGVVTSAEREGIVLALTELEMAAGEAIASLRHAEGR